MMASIPNMRSGLLPVPTGKAAPAGEGAPGDFAAQMPVMSAQPAAPEPLVPVIIGPIAPTLPVIGEEMLAVEGEDAAEATADAPDTPDTPDTPKAEPPAQPRPLEQPMAVVIPFLPQQVVAPAAQVPPAVAAGETLPAEPQEPQAQVPTLATSLTLRPARVLTPTPAGNAGLPAGKIGAEKTDRPGPAVADAPKEQAEATELEAAVKELLQRKEILAKQVAAAPRKAPADKAASDATPVQAQAEAQPQVRTPAQTQTQTQTQTQATPSPVTVQAVALPVAELPQPALAPLAPQPAPVSVEKAATVEGTRATDLAAERQLDLARDTEWLDRLARDIARAGASDTPLRFRLHPQTLGSLHVELQQGDRGTAVRLTVETEAARQILSDAQPRLAAEARAQGVRIAETHVDLSGSGRHAPGDQRRQDDARQTPLIRTPRGSGPDAVASARSSARARLDRYA